MNSNKAPRVSVCIPVYNGLPFIEATIESVLNQTFQDFEIIVRDDCSKDGTFEFLQARYGDDPRFRIRRNAFNIDVGGQYNSLFSEARGEFIHKLDADDFIEPTFLQKAVHAIDQFGADVVMAGWEWFDGVSLSRRRPAVHADMPSGPINFPLGIVAEKNPFSLCFGIWRQSLLERIARDGQYVLFTETCDWECQLRLALAGARFHYLEEVLGQYHLHDGNRSYRPNVQLESILCDVLPYWHQQICAELGRSWMRRNVARLLRDHIFSALRKRTRLSPAAITGAVSLLSGRARYRASIFGLPGTARYAIGALSQTTIPHR